MVLAAAEVERLHGARISHSALGRRVDDLHRAASQVDDARGLLAPRVQCIHEVVECDPAVQPLVAPVEDACPRALEHEAGRAQVRAN